jgi:uncharacterized protein (TIGR02996 family)
MDSSLTAAFTSLTRAGLFTLLLHMVLRRRRPYADVDAWCAVVFDTVIATRLRCVSTNTMAKKRILTPDQAFFQSIRDSPRDDTPRLVYADWLEETGQPERAEFIRLQYRLAEMDEDDPDRPALKDREWELLAVNGERWREGIPGWMRKEKHEFRRGFVSSLVLSGAQFLRKASAMYRSAPIAELRIRLAGAVRVPQIAAAPALRRLRSFAIGNGLGVEAIRTLLASPHLTGLEELGLSGNRMAADGVRALARWPGLQQLKSLDVSANALDAAALRPLLSCSQLGGLTRLNLGGNAVGDAVRELATAGALAALRRLSLARCAVETEGLEVLGKAGNLSALTSLNLSGLPPDACRSVLMSPLAAQLTSLDLQRSTPGAQITEVIASAPDLGRLRRLDLTMSYFGDDAMPAIARARFGSLTTLSLNYCRLGPAGIQALANSPHLASVEHLFLGTNLIGPDGAQALASSRCLMNLRTLNLASARITPGGAKQLAAWPGLARVTTLILNHCLIGPEGVRALAASPHVSNVRILELASNTLTDEAADALAASRSLGQLRKLVLIGNYITDAGRKVVIESPSLPNLIAVNLHWRGDGLVPRLAADSIKEPPNLEGLKALDGRDR